MKCSAEIAVTGLVEALEYGDLAVRSSTHYTGVDLYANGTGLSPPQRVANDGAQVPAMIRSTSSVVPVTSSSCGNDQGEAGAGHNKQLAARRRVDEFCRSGQSIYH